MKKLYSFALAALVALSAAAAPATKVTATRTLDTRSVMQAVESSRTFQPLSAPDFDRMKVTGSAKLINKTVKAPSRADEDATLPERPDFNKLEYGDWTDAGTCNLDLGVFSIYSGTYEIPTQEGVVMQERVCKTDAKIKQFLLKGVSYGDYFDEPMDLTLNCLFDENGDATIWFHSAAGQLNFTDVGVLDVYFTDLYTYLVDGNYTDPDMTDADKAEYFADSYYTALTGEFSLNACFCMPSIPGETSWGLWAQGTQASFITRIGSEFKNLDFNVTNAEVIKEDGKVYMVFSAALNDLDYALVAVKDAAFAQTTRPLAWATGVLQGTDSNVGRISADGEYKIEIPNAEKGYYFIYYLTVYDGTAYAAGAYNAFFDPDWDFYGTATYYDPFCYGYFGLTSNKVPYIPELKVDVEKNNQEEGYYRIVNPYATFGGVRFGSDTDPNLLLYEPETVGGNDFNLYFHADDKGNAYIDTFTTGLIWVFLNDAGSQVYIPITIGALANDDIESEGSYDAAIAAYPEDFGTFKEGVLYFPCDMSEADKENSSYYSPLYFAVTKNNSFNIFFDQPILKMDDSAIRDIVNDAAVDANAPVEYFNLQGIRVANPENGLYIRRQGRTVSKVLVK